MSQYTFDDSGASFVYFLVTLLAIYVIPAGIYYLKAAFSVLRSHASDCVCSTCKHRKRSRTPPKSSPFRSKWFYGWVVAFVSFLCMAYVASRLHLTSMAFDPYTILGVDTSADQASVKKRYKQLSLEWHPDRNPDNPEAEKKFIDISKAYKVLTDEATRANWEKYGNPDGTASFSLGIALPKWLIDQKNMVIVLGAYGIVFGVIGPFFLARWWRSSKRYTKDKILNDTMVVFFHELKDQMTTKKILETISVAFEFKEQLKLRPQEDAALRAIERQLKHYEKSSRFYAPYCLKTAVLLHAHLERVTIEDSLLAEDQQFIVQKTVHLLNAVIQIAAVRGWLTTTLAAIELFPMLIQATNDDLYQLPFMTTETKQLLANLKVMRPAIVTSQQQQQQQNHLSSNTSPKSLSTMQAKTVTVKSMLDFMTKINVDEKLSVAKSIFKSSDAVDEFLTVAEKIPLLSADVQASNALNDSLDTVSIGGPVNLTVRLKVTYPLKKQTLEGGEQEKEDGVEGEKRKGEENEEKDDDVEKDSDDLLEMADKERKRKAALVERQQSLLVETPYFNAAVKPAWYIAFGQQQSGSLIGAPLRVADVEEEKTIVIQFTAPPKAGIYALQIFIKSECFLGLDVKKEVKLNVTEKADALVSGGGVTEKSDMKEKKINDKQKSDMNASTNAKTDAAGMNHQKKQEGEELVDYDTDKDMGSDHDDSGCASCEHSDQDDGEGVF